MRPYALTWSLLRIHTLGFIGAVREYIMHKFATIVVDVDTPWGLAYLLLDVLRPLSSTVVCEISVRLSYMNACLTLLSSKEFISNSLRNIIIETVLFYA